LVAHGRVPRHRIERSEDLHHRIWFLRCGQEGEDNGRDAQELEAHHCQGINLMLCLGRPACACGLPMTRRPPSEESDMLYRENRVMLRTRFALSTNPLLHSFHAGAQKRAEMSGVRQMDRTGSFIIQQNASELTIETQKGNAGS